MKNPPLPKLPPDPGLSEFFPLASRKISVLRSGLLVPGLATIVVGVLLFALLPGLGSGASDQLFVGTLAGYLILLIVWAILRYADWDRPLWVLLFPASVVAGLLVFRPLLSAILYVFREILPGGEVPTNASFFRQFGSHFFGAGLAEELIKAAPALVGFFLALRPIQNSIADRLRLRGPLDGVVYGVVAGAVFTFIETALIYVPKYGLELLFPRVFIVPAGHIAYAGIFGYFIGLALARPTYRWPLLVGGWFLAASAHALWNASGLTFIGLAGAAFTYVLFLACLLKARQLAGQQSHMAARGGSIIAGASSLALGSIVAGNPGPASGQVAHGIPMPPATQAESFQLLVEGRIIPLRSGLQIDLGKLPGLRHANGIVFAVTVHPKDAKVQGLQNLGSQAWTTVHDGKTRQIDPQRNIRISHGTLISFGPVQGSIHRI